jgi:hypothetical protein
VLLAPGWPAAELRWPGLCVCESVATDAQPAQRLRSVCVVAHRRHRAEPVGSDR